MIGDDTIVVDIEFGTFMPYLRQASLAVHGPADCAQDPTCCIHKPSSHPLSTAPLIWRADRSMMERRCPHGIGHPDPDDLAYKREHNSDFDQESFGVHACDGCCQEAR